MGTFSNCSGQGIAPSAPSQLLSLWVTMNMSKYVLTCVDFHLFQVSCHVLSYPCALRKWLPHPFRLTQQKHEDSCQNSPAIQRWNLPPASKLANLGCWQTLSRSTFWERSVLKFLPMLSFKVIGYNWILVSIDCQSFSFKSWSLCQGASRIPSQTCQQVIPPSSYHSLRSLSRPKASKFKSWCHVNQPGAQL